MGDREEQLMSRFGVRTFIIRALGGHAPEEVEEEEEVTARMVVMGPDGPVDIDTSGPAPEGMPPQLASMLGFGGSGPMDPGRTDPGANPSRPPTLRQGPASKGFAMRVIDCVNQLDPAGDPEVQMLLSAGWEPFGVHKFSSFTGAEGVRIYFKRPGPRHPGGPGPTPEA